MTAARRLDLDGLKRLGMDKLADLVRKEDEEQALTGAQRGATALLLRQKPGTAKLLGVT
jgi:hypothetical protein